MRSLPQNLGFARGDTVTAKLRSWWQKYSLLINLLAMVACVLFFVFILAIYLFGWDWTGFSGYKEVTTTHIIKGTSAGTITSTEEYLPGKTLWDWLQLIGVLAIPIVVGFGAAWFSYKQNLTTSRVAVDQQREDALQAYLDNMSELMLKEHLGDLIQKGALTPGYEDARQIAQARTLNALSRLDSLRKRSVIQFLYEANLINIFDWSNADLSDATLSEITLSEVNFNGANLSGANFSFADLSYAKLRRTNFSGADLTGADLQEADLTGADLTNAHLSGANFNGANLSRANLSAANLTKFMQWNPISAVQDQLLLNIGKRGRLGRLISSLSEQRNFLSINVDAINVTFRNGTNLMDANLSEANLSFADLRDATLERANLKKANLQSANLTRANLKEANLTEARMSRFERTMLLIPSFFKWTDYPNRDDLEKGFPDTNVVSTTETKKLLAKFDGAKARLIRVDLRRRNLRVIELKAETVDLSNADLHKAIISPEQLHETKLLKGATMPDGAIHP